MASRTLTPRQHECWRLLWRGYSNAGVAEELGLCDGAARNLVSATLGRLGVRTREEAAARYQHTAGALDGGGDDAEAAALLDATLGAVEATLCDVRNRLLALDRTLATPRRYVAEHRGDDGAA